jgi:hypothetical protein
VLAAESAAIRPGAHRAEDLGRKHDVVARRHLVEPAPGYLFASADRVDVRRIEEIDARFQREREMLARFFGAERPVAAHRPRRQFAAAIAHASEAKPRNRRSRVAKFRKLHCRSSPCGTPIGVARHGLDVPQAVNS